MLQDHNGGWLVGATENLGVTTSVHVELWGIFQGLQPAWERGVRDVILETASLVAVTLLRRDGGSLGPYALLVEKCRELLRQARREMMCHIYMEENMVGDRIANWAVHLHLGIHVFKPFPAGVIPLLKA